MNAAQIAASIALYALAFVGGLTLLTGVFLWAAGRLRLGEVEHDVPLDVIAEQRHEYEHAQWRNNVRPIAPTTLDGAEVRYVQPTGGDVA